MANNFCTNCGAKLNGGNFCTQCGAPVTQDSDFAHQELSIGATQDLSGIDKIDGSPIPPGQSYQNPAPQVAYPSLSAQQTAVQQPVVSQPSQQNYQSPIQQQPDYASAPYATKKGPGAALIIGIVACLALLLLGVALFVLRPWAPAISSGASSAETSAQSSASATDSSELEKNGADAGVASSTNQSVESSASTSFSSQDSEASSSTPQNYSSQQEEVRQAAISAGMQVFSGTIHVVDMYERWQERSTIQDPGFEPGKNQLVILDFDTPSTISAYGAGYTTPRVAEGDSINLDKTWSQFEGQHVTVAATENDIAWPSDVSGVMYSVSGTATLLYVDGQAPVVDASSFVPSSDYILPDSSTRVYSRSELEGLSSDDLSRAQNEIWARHGRMFKNQWLQNYFNAQSWYVGTISPDDFNSVYKSTKIEDENAATINAILQDRGWDVNKAHPN